MTIDGVEQQSMKERTLNNFCDAIEATWNNPELGDVMKKYEVGETCITAAQLGIRTPQLAYELTRKGQVRLTDSQLRHWRLLTQGWDYDELQDAVDNAKTGGLRLTVSRVTEAAREGRAAKAYLIDLLERAAKRVTATAQSAEAEMTSANESRQFPDVLDSRADDLFVENDEIDARITLLKRRLTQIEEMFRALEQEQRKVEKGW